MLSPLFATEMTTLFMPKNRRYGNVEQLQKRYSPSMSRDGRYSGLAILQPLRWPTISEDRMFPYKDAMPCEACKAILVRDLLSATGYRHQNLALARSAAENGCEICNLILCEFVNCSPSGELDWDLGDPIILTLANASGTPYCQDELFATVGENFALLGLYTDEGR